MKIFLVLFVAVILAAGCERKQPQGPATVKAKFESRESRFSAEFPGEPTQTSQPSPNSGHLVHAYRLKVSGQLAYIVTCEEVPLAQYQNSNVALQETVRGTAMIQKGTVTTETPLTHDAYPARAYEIDCGSLLLRGRYVLAGNRLYNVSALVSKKILAERSQEVTRFIESFKVLN